MDNAVATTAQHPSMALANSPLVPANPGLASRWQALPARSQLSLMVGAAALLAVLAFMFMGARDSDYRVLFPDLSDKDTGAVVDKLSQLGVPYKFAEGGSTILVPASRVRELRAKMANAGLPGRSSSGNALGYELMDHNSFGQTQGQERVKLQRAIEGELTNTIQSLEGVKAVRVHLALAKQDGFFREQQKPSASVAITMHPGRTLDRSQIAGIVRLVSGSVPELAPKAVAVVDSSGNLLTVSSDDEGAQGLDSQQLQYRREVEAGHLKRILALLEPVVGRDNVRASVTADIDFSRVMRTAESYGPNQGPDAKPAVREQRTEESSQPGSATPGGIPGATSNQPPVPAQAPINGASQAMSGAGGGAGNGTSTRREAATQYAVDRTTTVTQAAVGNVRRLSAAVVVNHKSVTDAKGKTSSVPLSEKEIEQLSALVQQGIGFNQERGDVVKIVNAPFRVEAAAPADDTPAWKQPWLLDLLKTAMAPLALAVVALVIVFKLIKPALGSLMAPPPAPEPGTQVSEVVGEDDAAKAEAMPALPAPLHHAKLESARAMAKQNPAAVANIVRGWVSGEV